MKMKYIAALFLGLSLSASAAIYIPSNVINGDGSTDALIQNNDNSLNSGGTVLVGYFAAGYIFSSLDTEALMLSAITDFTSVASASIGGNSASLGGAFAGYYEGVTNDTAAITSGSLLGRALYVFAGNSGTLAGSTEWAIKQFGTIASDDPNEQTYVANPFGGTAPQFGSFGTFTGNASGFGSSTFQTLQLAAVVPEPSAALLGAIGALGLLRRRRN